MSVIHLNVNGRQHTVETESVEPGLLLLDYLREHLHLTGTKRGCDEKACGACTVLVDDKAVRSCHVKVADLDGKTITTIEGLARNGVLDPVQQAFIDHSAVQCGFCTPGLIMGVHGLLRQNPNPTDEEIKKGLRLHLCRCGTYPRLIGAVRQAAAALRGEPYEPARPYRLPETEKNYIGKPVVRKDYRGKVDGSTKFFADYQFENMLYGQAVYAEHPCAEILAIHTEKAEQAPGVRLVLTHKDVPGSNRYGGGFRDQQVLCEKYVKFRGDAVAVVFADSVREAEAAAALVEVDYRVLPGIFTIEDALKPDAPVIPDPNGPKGTLPGLYLRGEKGNICREVQLHRGNIEDAFAKSDVIVEGDFTVPREEHAWIEVDGAVSRYDEQHRLCVYAPNQDPFGDLEQLVEILGLDESQIRVIHTPCGGAFGGKLELTTHAFVAIATYLTGRPAKMVLRRKDSIRTHSKRHPAQMHYKLGVRKTGEILGLQVVSYNDGGPYLSWSHRTVEQSLSWGSGPYNIPALDMKATVVYTNNPVCGAMRGFGANQTTFAMESVLDMAARELHMDPITIREINAMDYDKIMPTGQRMRREEQGINFKQTLKMLRSAMERTKAQYQKPGECLGYGVACGWRSIGGGMGNPDRTGAQLELLPDGRVLYRISCVEMGQGSQTSLMQIASESSGVSMEDYELIAGDTANVPYGGHVSASRGVFLWGHPTMEAGRQFKERILELAAGWLSLELRDLDLRNSCVILQKTGETLMTLREVARKLGQPLVVRNDYDMPPTVPVRWDTNEAYEIPEKDYRTHYTASYTTAGALVRIDPESGAVQVLHVTSITDCGKVINPEAAATQIEGCVVMGTAYALTNHFKVKDGIVLSDSLGKCKVPRITDCPDSIEVLFAEEEDPVSPYGAKGLAEIGVLTVAPAICNAIADASGARIHDLPVNEHLDDIRAAMQSWKEKQNKDRT